MFSNNQRGRLARATDFPFMLTGSFALGVLTARAHDPAIVDFVVALMERTSSALVTHSLRDFYNR